jgi:POT family proton-dependent oligopeptide transporter
MADESISELTAGGGTLAAVAHAAGASHDRAFFGHPRGLATLFFTEMWERFSYYGMRALLLLFMTAPLAAGGFGWDVAKAGPIYGLYTAMVYLSALPGGWVADRLIGQRRAVLWGGIIIALGHLSLTFHSVSTFYLGLFLIVVGTGLLKPNISSMVGSLYAENDARRDAGFSIFYMGINLGAFMAPLVCGFLAQSETFRGWLGSVGITPENSWHWGFGAATVGMGLGVIQYALGGRSLGEAGLHPDTHGDPVAQRKAQRVAGWAAAGIVALAVPLALLQYTGRVAITVEGITDAVGNLLIVLPVVYFVWLLTRKDWTRQERMRLGAIPFFFLFAAIFWSAFEQAGSTLNLFADRFTDTRILGWEFPSTWFQSANSIYIIMLAPVFAWLWVKLGKRNPSSPMKFAFGLIFLSLGFLLLVPGARLAATQDGGVSPFWLLGVYLLHTIGELCLSPVGLSTMTKLAPARVGGQMMGIWFLAAAVGNFIGGQVGGLFESFPLPKLFGAIFLTTAAAGVVLLLLARPVRKLMDGVR